MLWLQFGNVEKARMREFQGWTKKNEALLEKYAPSGWAYRGTFGAVLGFGKYDVTQIWELSKYGDFDTLRNHEDETWLRLNDEMVDFFLPGSGQAVLLRELGDVKIAEPKRKKEK